jgi:hypothetical protein
MDFEFLLSFKKILGWLNLVKRKRYNFEIIHPEDSYKNNTNI